MVHKSDKFTDFKRSFENCQCIFANRSIEKVEGKMQVRRVFYYQLAAFKLRYGSKSRFQAPQTERFSRDNLRRQ